MVALVTATEKLPSTGLPSLDASKLKLAFPFLEVATSPVFSDTSIKSALLVTKTNRSATGWLVAEKRVNCTIPAGRFFLGMLAINTCLSILAFET
ncbi:hypothetical protein D3C73_1211310 [compost metagenome]